MPSAGICGAPGTDRKAWKITQKLKKNACTYAYKDA